MTTEQIKLELEHFRNRCRTLSGSAQDIANALRSIGALVCVLVEKQLDREAAASGTPKQPYKAPSLVEKERLAALALTTLSGGTQA